MLQNVGTIDRLARIVAGLILLSLRVFAASGSGWKWLGGLVVRLVLTCPPASYFRLVGAADRK
jgi:hypothetical protein